MKLYHIDRKQVLSEGQVLELNKFKGFTDVYINIENHKELVDYSKEFNQVISDLFNNELSNHGLTYVDSFASQLSEVKLEVLYELIRQIKFNRCPSRYKSFFAIEGKDVQKFMKFFKLRKEECNIFEVIGSNYFKADMTLLRGDGNLADVIFAKKYWNQEQSQNPMMEYLLSFPITIVKQIDIDNFIGV